MDVALSYLLSSVQIEDVSLTAQNGVDLYSNKKDDAKTKTETETESETQTQTDTETEAEAVKPAFASYFFSNLATKAVLDILANGSENGSEQQQGLLFHSHGRPLDWINEIFPLTVEFLNETGYAGGPIIKYTPGIWVDRSVEFKEPFHKVIRDMYKPDFHTEEFTDTEALKREVNGWLQEKTSGLLENALGSYVIADDTRLILATALHFEGEWFKRFQDAGVQKFTLLNGQKVDMPCMTSKGKHYVKQFENYKLLSIPFKQNNASRFSMLVYLSDHIQDTEKLRDFVGQQESVIQDVYFPEEQVEVGDFIIPQFKLNVRGPLPWDNPYDFPNMANSTGMISRGGWLSSIVEINEGGIRVAGSTTFFINEKPPEPKTAPRSIVIPSSTDKIEFVANRPFIFFIRDNRFGRMLFSGAVINPVG